MTDKLYDQLKVWHLALAVAITLVAVVASGAMFVSRVETLEKYGSTGMQEKVGRLEEKVSDRLSNIEANQRAIMVKLGIQ